MLTFPFADGSPLCLTSTVLPYQLFREIETYDFEQNSLYQVLEEQYHIQITTTSLKLKAVSAYGNISRFIDVKWLLLYKSKTVELKFCERIRNRRMRKEDAYMASMQSFAMRASFQLPVEIVLGGNRPVKSETFMIWMRVLIDNAPMSEKTKDQLVCMLIMSGFVILFWGIKGYREKRKTEE